MEDFFKTISAQSNGIYKEKGSRFLAFAFPVYSEDEIKENIRLLRKEHNSAQHHCYAWRIGHDKNQFRAYDDGEPSSTAGKPILGQIISNDLTNVLIIVVRYFGGTLLGVSGLINAYRSAAEDAIKSSEIVEKIVERCFDVSFGYDKINAIMKIIKDEKLPQLNPKFDTMCRITTLIRLNDTERILNLIYEIGDISITERI